MRTLTLLVFGVALIAACAPRGATFDYGPAPTLDSLTLDAPAAPAVRIDNSRNTGALIFSSIGILAVGAVAGGTRTETEHVAPEGGRDAERSQFGKYHGLDPWDDPALMVSEPGVGLVFDVRELPQPRPGWVTSPVTGREFEIGPNVVAQAGKGGALIEPGFDKNGRARTVAGAGGASEAEAEK